MDVEIAWRHQDLARHLLWQRFQLVALLSELLIQVSSARFSAACGEQKRTSLGRRIPASSRFVMVLCAGLSLMGNMGVKLPWADALFCMLGYSLAPAAAQVADNPSRRC